MQVGGNQIDEKLTAICIEKFQKAHNRDISKNSKAKRRLKIACEKAKQCLTKYPETTITVDSLVDDLDFSYRLTKQEFQELIQNDCKRSIEIID